MTIRRRNLLVVALLVGLALLGVTIGAFEDPKLESVHNEWGNISDRTAEIRSTITVTNPNPIGIPSILGIGYHVRLNDVTVATGTRNGIGLSPGANTIQLTTEMNNSKIASWWVTHVARTEQSTLTIDPHLTINPIPVEIDLPNQREPVRTDVLAPINDVSEESVNLVHDPHLVIEEQTAQWGSSTSDHSSIIVRTTVTNRFSVSAVIEDIQYRINMNEATVGDGHIDDSYRIPAGSMETLESRILIDNGKMNDWWVSHLRNEEHSVVEIEITAVVRVDGTTERVPLQFPDQTSNVNTDVLGQSTVETP